MYAEKYYALQAGGLFSGLKKLAGKVAGVVSSIGAPLAKIPIVGKFAAKIVPKFIPGLGLISTAATVAGLAKTGTRLLAGRAGGFGMKAIGTAGGMTAGKSLLGPTIAGGAAVGGGTGLYELYRQEAERQGLTAPQARSAARAATGRRYRRQNPCNIRALRRSMRRVNSFAKIARKAITFTKRVKVRKGRRAA